MKKIYLVLALLLITGSKTFAGRNDSLYVFSSTVIAGSNTTWTKLNSTGSTVLVDYQVLSTGTFTADVMDIFDTANTTGAAQKSWTDFPVRDYVNYPLGIETTTGTYISVRSDPFTKVRVRYYRSYVPTTE